jgi:ABC-type lipoprotein release transport system permease subunit
MQQFYMGMLSISNSNEYLTIEIANAIGTREFVFFMSVSNNLVDLFEKQILSIFPDARIEKKTDDFNVFNEEGLSVGCYALQKEVPAKPITTIEEMNTDPLRVLLNVFSKLR